jgi:hypothetical protein
MKFLFLFLYKIFINNKFLILKIFLNFIGLKISIFYYLIYYIYNYKNNLFILFNNIDETNNISYKKVIIIYDQLLKNIKEGDPKIFPVDIEEDYHHLFIKGVSGKLLFITLLWCFFPFSEFGYLKMDNRIC